MLVSSKQLAVPDTCGDFCPRFREFGYKFPMQYQGDDCYRCPILLCSKDEDGWSIMEPEELDHRLVESYLEWWEASK